MTTQRSGGPAHSKQEHRRLIRHRMWNMRALYAMIFVGVVYFVVFRYATMYGVLIAFKNFKARQGIWGSQWVGLKNFAAVFGGPDVARVFKNDTFPCYGSAKGSTKKDWYYIWVDGVWGWIHSSLVRAD